MYCKGMPCVDAEVGLLHKLSQDSRADDTQRVDRYLYLCGIVDLCEAAGGQQGGGAGTGRQRMRITCPCGDPGHDVVMCKARPTGRTSCYPFDVGHLSSKSSRGQQAGSLSLPASCFVQDLHETMQFGLLPDLGMYIRVIIQRRYFTPGSVKHSRRSAKLLEGCSGASASPGPGSPHVDGAGASAPVPIAFVEGFIDGLCCTLLQESIPCMRKAKRSIRLTVFQSSPTNVEVAACINVLHGTLLSLYPKAVRRPTFAARVPLALRIRDLLCSSREQQILFLSSYPHLVKLCFMEYVMNLLEECMPVELQLLLRMPSMKLYQSVCQTTCDSFRSEVLATGAEGWGELDSAACLFIDRCIRMCKFKMYRTLEPVCRVHETHLTFRKEALDMPNSYGCMALMQLLGGPGGSEDALASAVRLQTMLTTHRLPSVVAQMQLRALGSMYGSCCKMSFAACHKHVCCVCALSGKGISSSLRLCSETGNITCVCGVEGSMVRVNMIGVLLKVCNTSYYMCPCCTNVRVWKGDGYDLNLAGCVGGGGGGCGCQGAGRGEAPNWVEDTYPLGWNGAPGSIGVNKLVDSCSVCASKHTGSHKPIYVPDAETRTLKRVVLCSKHRLPEHVLKNVWSYKDFLHALGHQVSR